MYGGGAELSDVLYASRCATCTLPYLTNAAYSMVRVYVHVCGTTDAEMGQWWDGADVSFFPLSFLCPEPRRRLLLFGESGESELVDWGYLKFGVPGSVGGARRQGVSYGCSRTMDGCVYVTCASVSVGSVVVYRVRNRVVRWCCCPKALLNRKWNMHGDESSPINRPCSPEKKGSPLEKAVEFGLITKHRTAEARRASVIFAIVATCRVQFFSGSNL